MKMLFNIFHKVANHVLNTNSMFLYLPDYEVTELYTHHETELVVVVLRGVQLLPRDPRPVAHSFRSQAYEFRLV